MSDLKILTTSDYDKFKTVEGNRDVNESHVRKIKQSLEEKNLLEYNPILVTKEMQIIDGQHRLEAARRLRIPVPYIIIPDADLTTIQQLNSNLRSWNAKDFAESYARLGKGSYIRLLKFCDEYDFPIVLSAELLAGTSGGGNIPGRSGDAHISHRIRNGTFEIRNENNALALMQQLRDLQPFCDAKVWRVPAFIRTLIRLYRVAHMDHKTLVAQLRKTGVRLRRQANAREYTFQIVEAYNHGLKKNRINPIISFDEE